jgi:hypothetical protein
MFNLPSVLFWAWDLATYSELMYPCPQSEKKNSSCCYLLDVKH